MSDNADASSLKRIAIEKKASSAAFKRATLIIAVPFLLSILFFYDGGELSFLGLFGAVSLLFFFLFLRGTFYLGILNRELAALICPQCNKELALSTSKIDSKLLSTAPRRRIRESEDRDGPVRNGHPTWVKYNVIEEWTEEKWQTKYSTGCSFCSYNKVFTENSTKKIGYTSHRRRI